MKLASLALLVLWPCPAAQQPDEIGIHLIALRMVRTPVSGAMNPRITVETETEFLITDPVAWTLVDFTGGHKGDKIRLEWRNPLGVVAQQNEHIQLNDSGAGGAGVHLQWALLISGAPASLAPGEWEARLLWNDRQAGAVKFHISAPPDSAVAIGTRSLLPSASTTVPYFVQLTAHGGSPPYQWFPRKAPPQGLTLSSTGVISGTPAQRGSFRIVVEARDAAGNSTTRTLGIAVSVVSRDAHAAARTIAGPAGRAGACSSADSQTNIPNSAASVVFAAMVEARGGRGRVEWLDPRGELFQSVAVGPPKDGRQCMVKALPVAGHRVAQDPGDWRVRLIWDSFEVITLKFAITGPKPETAPVARAGRSGRLAILIANSRYDKLPAVEFAAADFDALENALRQDGFEVIRRADANLDNLRSIEQTLDDKLQAGDTALVYYHGYDAHSGKDDWLLPVNYDPGDSRPMQAKAYSTLRLMQFFEDSKAAVRFIVLDTSAAGAKAAPEDPEEVISEVDGSTALIYCNRPGTPSFGFARALAEAVGKPGMDARNALQIELPKAASKSAASSAAPVTILGGGADFVFRAPGR